MKTKREKKPTDQTYRDYLDGKLSNMITLMCDGILRAEKLVGFGIDMGTFGRKSDSTEICYGCAATCAVMQAEPEKLQFVRNDINRALPKGMVWNEEMYRDLLEFENAVDALRQGNIYHAADYLMLSNTNRTKAQAMDGCVRLRILTNGYHTYAQPLKSYRTYARELKAAGL